jgi:hypothetical protein
MEQAVGVSASGKQALFAASHAGHRAPASSRRSAGDFSCPKLCKQVSQADSHNEIGLIKAGSSRTSIRSSGRGA